jgi:hypothetical protein
LQNFFENQKFYPPGIEPSGPILYNLSERTGGFLIHYTLVLQLFSDSS